MRTRFRYGHERTRAFKDSPSSNGHLLCYQTTTTHTMIHLLFNLCNFSNSTIGTPDFEIAFVQFWPIYGKETLFLYEK